MEWKGLKYVEKEAYREEMVFDSIEEKAVVVGERRKRSIVMVGRQGLGGKGWTKGLLFMDVSRSGNTGDKSV
jgi:hypothetical protein